MSTENIISILRAPHVSEKSVRLQEQNQYVFLVAPGATKGEVKAAVEQMFDVKVINVNLINVKGKQKTFRFRVGRRPGARKAYVRLAEGQGIDVLARA